MPQLQTQMLTVTSPKGVLTSNYLGQFGMVKLTTLPISNYSLVGKQRPATLHEPHHTIRHPMYALIKSEMSTPNGCQSLGEEYPPEGSETGQKPIRVEGGIMCNIAGCTRVYRTKWELMAHQVDTGHLGNYCPMCDQWCSTKGTLKRHIQTVHGEKAWKCRNCGKTFNRQDNLRTHQQQIHGETTEN